MDPNFKLKGNKSVTQGFLMPTREVIANQETAEQGWLNLSLGLLKCFVLFLFFVMVLFFLRDMKCIILNLIYMF